MIIQAMVHSLGKMDNVVIVSHTNDNDVTALYRGKMYTAIFNCFTNCYYVDDIDGAKETI